mgnify:CR=1 FL=1
MLWSIYEDDIGRIWLPGYLGIYQWMPEADIFRFHPIDLPFPDGPPPYYIVFDLFLTGEDWLLATTGIDGYFVKFRPDDASYEVWKKDDYRWSTKGVSIASNRILLGRDVGNGGLQLLDVAIGRLSEVDIQFDDPNAFPISAIISMLRDDNGNIWLGTQHGPLLKYSPQKNPFYWLELPWEGSGAVTDMEQAPDGRYWIATLGNGLHRWDRPTGKIESFRVERDNANTP